MHTKRFFAGVVTHVGGRLSLKLVLDILRDGMDWIHRVEDRGHWHSSVITVMNVWVP